MEASQRLLRLWSRVLESNATLTYLDLHQPFLCGDDRTWPFDDDYHDVPLELTSDSGASALARALRTNCALTYLVLGDNAVGESGLSSSYWGSSPIKLQSDPFRSN